MKTANHNWLPLGVTLLFPVFVLACKQEKALPIEEFATAASVQSCTANPTPAGRLTVDFDGDGSRETNVDLFQIDFEPSLVARWKSREDSEDEIWAVATQVIVTLKPGVLPKQVLQRSSNLLHANVQAVPLEIPRTYLVSITPTPGEAQPGKILQSLPTFRSDSEVESIEPNYLFTLNATPRDTHFNKQDDLKRMRAPKAWDDQTGNSGIRVAVIDSGIDPDHPDLKGNRSNVWKDFVKNKPQPYDDNGHGTQSSGLIGAVGDNVPGIAGVNWRVSLLPIKALDKKGCGSNANLAQAIHFAIQKKANVISASWGGATGADAHLIEKAIQRADAEKILFVAAAGNKPIDRDTHDFIPGTLQLPNLISVSAVTDQDRLRSDSGFGRRRIHLSAPGEGVLSTYPTQFKPSNPYELFHQTSAATALVAGACALAKAEHPSLNYLQIRRLILDSTVRIQQQKASCSKGRLDLANAIRRNLVNTNSC